MGKNSTIEFTARARVAADTVAFSGEGTFIMSEGSFLCGGERAAITIAPETTVVMLQDAILGHEITVQRDECFASVFGGGTLEIGLPDRPIRKDMPFPLAGVLRDKLNRQAAANSRASGASLIVGKTGRLVMHSADPAKARVIFSMWNTDRAKAEGKKWGTPEGIVLVFAGRSRLDGVVFDNCYEGGIIASPQQRTAWKNGSRHSPALGATDVISHGSAFSMNPPYSTTAPEPGTIRRTLMPRTSHGRHLRQNSRPLSTCSQ